MKLLCYIVLVISITMTTAMKISQVERMTDDYFDQFLNESSIEDSIEIEVNNYGMSQQSITYYLYLPQNIDVLDFSSKKIETSLSAESPKVTTLKPFTLKDEGLLNDEQLSGMSKVILSEGEISKLNTNYKLIDDEVEKKLNSFLIVVEFTSENPEQLYTVISSANFKKQNYPNEARHRWLFKCSPEYSIKLNVTNFQLEKNSDEILLYDATPSGNNIVGEITSLGDIETTSSELLISFKSDCGVTNKGFQVVVEFVEKPTDKKINTSDIEQKTESFTYEPTTANEETTYSPTTTPTYHHNVPTFKVKQKYIVIETTTQQSNSSADTYGDDNTYGVRNTYEEVVEEADERHINFTFFITMRTGSWFEALQMCEEQGGNLISESLKPKWDLLSKIVEFKNANKDKALWFGIKKNNLKKWLLLDGSEQWVVDWYPGEPNNYGNRENCAHVFAGHELLLNDNYCYKRSYGLCEKQILA